MLDIVIIPWLLLILWISISIWALKVGIYSSLNFFEFVCSCHSAYTCQIILKALEWCLGSKLSLLLESPDDFFWINYFIEPTLPVIKSKNYMYEWDNSKALDRALLEYSMGHTRNHTLETNINPPWSFFMQ